MKERNEIDENLKWDIDLFKTQEEIEKAFENIEFLTNDVKNYYGKFTDKDAFFKYFLSNKDKQNNAQKLGYYISNTLQTDSSNVEMLKLASRFEVATTKLTQASSFVSAQIHDLSEDYLISLLSDPRSKDLDNFIKDIIKEKPHKLDEKTCDVVASLANSFNNSSSVFDVFTDSEMPFDDAENKDGEKIKVSNATYSELVSSKDRTLRKNAFNSTMNGYGKFNKTFAELFISSIKADNDSVKLHKYKNLLECELNAEDVPESVFNNNIENVKKNIPTLKKFIEIYANKMNLQDFTYYDLFQDDKITGNISIEQGKQLILDALKPLGEDYLNLVKNKLNDKSIDYMPNKNKSSGAYCSNCYDAKTLILMNWTNDYNSVSTLIHEMGHCINAEYFNKYQPMEKAGITIFAAEIASTVNEILLVQHMLKDATKDEQIYYLKEFLNEVRATIFRQTLFSEFELYAHTAIENEVPITYEELNGKYYELNKEYYGSSCILPENLKYEWSRIPHFYRPYYVYSYSTGMLTGITIANRLLTEPNFSEKYIYFLKNGTNKPAVEVLKEIGIDLTTNEPFDNAFKFIEEQVSKYATLCK